MKHAKPNTTTTTTTSYIACFSHHFCESRAIKRGLRFSFSIQNVPSGLGFTPFAQMPVYCATKAALHSLTMYLRHQLRDTDVRVFEIIPPIVTRKLGAPHRSGEVNRSAMPTEAAVSDIIYGLENEIFELAIGEAKNLVSKREKLISMMNAD